MGGTEQTPGGTPNRETLEQARIENASLNTSSYTPLEHLINERHMRWMEPTRLADERREVLLKANVPLLEHLGTAPLPTKYGDWTYVTFGDRTTGSHASALVYGDISNGAIPDGVEVPVRVHSACSASELFLAQGCGETTKIESWMSTIHNTRGPGVIIYLEQDGRGNGMQKFLQELQSKYFWNKEGTLQTWTNSGLPKEHQPEELTLRDVRDYHAARRILQHLNITHPHIVSDNKLKQMQLSPNFSEPILTCPNDEQVYYQLKANQIAHEMGHEWKEPWEAIADNKELLQSANHPIVKRLGAGPIKTEYGDWTMVAYGDYTSGEVHIALVFGEVRDVLDGTDVYPARVHSSCLTNEKFHAKNCECRAELHETMKRIQESGKGIIVYLQQEGRGNGVHGKMYQLDAMFGWQAGKIEQNTDSQGDPVTTVKGYEQHGFHGEIRDFTVAGAMLSDLGVGRIEHHSNNPRKRQGLESNGIKVEGVKNLHFPDLIKDNSILRNDLYDKMTGLKHDFGKLFEDKGSH